jgi:hypothetical protein
MEWSYAATIQGVNKWTLPHHLALGEPAFALSGLAGPRRFQNVHMFGSHGA